MINSNILTIAPNIVTIPSNFQTIIKISLAVMQVIIIHLIDIWIIKEQAAKVSRADCDIPKSSNLIQSDPIWSYLILSKPFWSFLILSDLIWSSLILFEVIWSNLIQFNASLVNFWVNHGCWIQQSSLLDCSGDHSKESVNETLVVVVK